MLISKRVRIFRFSRRHHSFRPTAEQRNEGLGQVGEAELRGDRRTAAAPHPVVHERGAGGRYRGRAGQRREEVQAPVDGQAVPVQAQKRARVPVAHQPAGGARLGVLHVRGHQRHREDPVHCHTKGQSQPVQ